MVVCSNQLYLRVITALILNLQDVNLMLLMLISPLLLSGHQYVSGTAQLC